MSCSSIKRWHDAGPALPRRLAGLAGIGSAIVIIACLSATEGSAQDPIKRRYFPLDQTTAPGVAARWTTAGRRNACNRPQPIRVELPGKKGTISIYTDSQGTEELLGTPADAAIQVGGVYRLKIGGMPDFPGVELYPTVELLDRLHPPRGREAEFPVPIAFSAEEIHRVIEGQMITKVVYLEQPDRATPAQNTLEDRTRIVDPRENVLAVADQAGRPIAIVRLGSRTPDPSLPEPDFYGTGSPVLLPHYLAEPHSTMPILESRR